MFLDGTKSALNQRSGMYDFSRVGNSFLGFLSESLVFFAQKLANERFAHFW